MKLFLAGPTAPDFTQHSIISKTGQCSRLKAGDLLTIHHAPGADHHVVAADHHVPGDIHHVVVADHHVVAVSQVNFL